MNFPEIEQVAPALAKRIKKHVTGAKRAFRAICHLGFETTTAREFEKLGLAESVQISPGAIDFEAKLEDAWKLLAFSRTSTRIIMRIAEFEATNFGKLTKKAAEIPWELYFPWGKIPEIRVTCRKSRLYHTDAVAERLASVLENALLSEALPRSQEASQEHPQKQTLFAHFESDRCILSVDLTGEALYKRGFERHVEDAPLRDTLAGAILFEAGLTETHTLIDPMAGSGTFSSEAMLLKAGAHLWKTRHFACEAQPAYRPAAWNYLTSHAKPIALKEDLQVETSDISTQAFATIEYNLKTKGAAPYIRGFESSLSLSRQDFFALPPAKEGSLLALNPPYGKRLDADVPRLYKEIGNKIRKDFSGAKIAIMVPSDDAEKALALRARKVIRTSHGGLNVKVLFI